MHKLLLFCVSVAATLAPTVAFGESEFHSEQSNFAPFTARVLGNKVRMRTNPSLDGHVVRETAFGELFGIVKEVNDFYAVMPPSGSKGYVFRTFILDGVVEGDRVNIRLSPDVEAPIVAQLHRGEKVNATVCNGNAKWLEVDLPKNATFFIAKEYLEKCGPIEMLAKIEARHKEATHHLNSAFLYAQGQLGKPFEEIEFDSTTKKFEDIRKNYAELFDITERAQEISSILQEAYVQKKIAFLESKAKGTKIERQLFTSEHIARLSNLGLTVENRKIIAEGHTADVARAASDVVGLSTNEGAVTDKMLSWQPLEDSLYHLWAAANGEKSLSEYYAEESINASVLTGIIEPYTRPVKNRPGDFVIKCNDMPTAFLYSSKINLQELVGKQVTLRASPRPNNNFAFPAYYVLSVE